MKNLKLVILTSIICAIVISFISSWVFEGEWSFLPYLLLAGCFLVWAQAEEKSYKFFSKLAIGSVIFGFLAFVLIFLRMYAMSRWAYDSPMPFAEIFDKDFMMMSAVFAFVSFLGGLAGIVLKGFYSLYKNRLDGVIIFAGPLLVMLSSLAIVKVKIGGTILSALHGWPYPFFIHQIKDVVDGLSIDKWIFLPGSLYHYVIFNYLLFLAIFILVSYPIKFINKKIKVNATFVLFGLLIFLVIFFTSFLSIKESYISRQISKAGYCEANSDCVIAGNKCPFSCAIVANKNEADRIMKLVNSFPSTCQLSCMGVEKTICIEGKCRIAINQTSDEINWRMIKQAVADCRVSKIMQTHSLEVTAELKTGEIIKAIEPEIDDIFKVVQEAEEKCGQIRMATE